MNLLDRLEFENVIDNYFATASKDKDVIFNLVKEESNLAYALYVIAHYVVCHYSATSYDYVKYINYYAKLTTCFVSPFATLGKFELRGVNIYIGDDMQCGDGLTLYGGVCIGKHKEHYDYDLKPILIGRNCTLYENVRVYNGATIGDNVVVNSGAIIKENISSDVVVDVVNQLQIKSSATARLPSQHLFVYGVVPKYKNSFVLYGTGFYNPKVILKLKNAKDVNTEITYWDKNKIIVKLKIATPISDDENMLIVMSNGVKVTLFNNFGLNMALKDIKN